MSVFEIILLSITIVIGFSIVCSTLALGISPMPSSTKARQAIVQLTHAAGTGPIFDLGSGWGGLLIALAKEYPQRKIVGYELSFMPWLVSSLLKSILGLKNIQIQREDFFQADLAEASVIVCYLFPQGMKKLEDKLMVENTQLKYLISNNFALSSQQPIKVIKLTDFYKSPVYLYTLENINK